MYLPTTSYIEMNEWTLPAGRAREYHALVEEEKNAGRFEAHKPFLRGGIWRNFMSRYSEANWMHKRMLGASRRLAALPPAQRAPEMQEWLHRSQANDAYWHGLFGGLYLPHLRRAIWNNLLQLEAALERLAPWPRQQQGDLDHDGHVETALRSTLLHAYVRDDGHAALVEFSSLALAHNFGDTLRAYPEAYHDKIRYADAGARTAASGAGIASAHDRVAYLHTILHGDADPDERPRGLFLDSAIDSNDMMRPLDGLCARRGARPLGGRRRRLAHRKALRPRGRYAERHLPHRGRATAGHHRNRDQPRHAQLRRLRRPLHPGRRQRARRRRRSAANRRHAPALRWTTAIRADRCGSRPACWSAAMPARIAPYRNPKPASKNTMQAVCITLAWSPASGAEQRITLRALPVAT